MALGGSPDSSLKLPPIYLLPSRSDTDASDFSRRPRSYFSRFHHLIVIYPRPMPITPPQTAVQRPWLISYESYES